jgi:hypothetical protein
MQHCKIKDIDWNTQNQWRGGVIPYTKYNDDLYLCLGFDAETNELTDFGGGIKKKEHKLSGALREFEEESLNIFGNYDIEKIAEEYVIFSKNMLIILINVDINPTETIKLFQEQVKSTINSEISNIIWLSKEKFINIIKSNNTKDRIMYNKVRNFLLQVSDFIETLN